MLGGLGVVAFWGLLAAVEALGMLISGRSHRMLEEVPGASFRLPWLRVSTLDVKLNSDDVLSRCEDPGTGRSVLRQSPFQLSPLSVKDWEARLTSHLTAYFLITYGGRGPYSSYARETLPKTSPFWTVSKPSYAPAAIGASPESVLNRDTAPRRGELCRAKKQRA